MDVSNQCRMCLAECNDDQLESMLIPCNESVNLWSMYEFIMNVDGIVESADVPHVCNSCKEDLTSAYHFKVMCMETERTLSENVKSYQTDNKTETEYVVFDSEENVVQYADDCIDGNVESSEDIDEDVLEDNEELREDSFVESTVESDVDGFQDTIDNLTDDSIDEIETVQQIDGDFITTEVCKCKKCNIKFGSITEYRAHYRQLHQKTYNRKLHKSNARSCPACNIQFENVRLYAVHYRKFHKRPIAQAKKDARPKKLCTHCGRLFSESFIKKHIQSKHSGDQKKEHVCTTCGRIFSLIENLIMHERIHTNDKRFECNVCGEKFLHWATRRNHIRSKHTGEMQYECHLCGQKFTQTSNLYRHIRRHRNELPHSCGACPKGFSTSEELKNHQIVHTKVKNEVCEICSKCFGTRKNLKAHMKVHSGERDYVCTVCEKRFTQAHVLRTHLKTHPGVEIPERGVILSQKALSRMGNVLKLEKIEN